MLGSSFTDNTVATGFGLHLAQPILRKEWTESMTVVEGKKLLEECMKVLYYRDGRTINRVSQTLSTCVSPCISRCELTLCCACVDANQHNHGRRVRNHGAIRAGN
jgi:hypothetical protein